jgi:hypothetical protein
LEDNIFPLLVCEVPLAETRAEIKENVSNDPIAVKNNTVDDVKTRPKEGFNYASFDCGAVVRTANREAKNPTSVLLNAKDAYFLTPCSSDIFVELELCQDILVKTISLANFEYFSSMFKDFEIFGSSNYPPDWKALGTFTAKNSRDRQYFSIENPVIWVKYVKLLINSHYGNEYYCPITSIQVYGTSMMEEAKEYQDLKPEVIAGVNQTSQMENIKVMTSTAPEPLKTSLPVTCPDIKPTFADEIEYSTTSSPTPTKQDSIFAKIIQRLTLLEKAAQELSNNLVELRRDFTKSQDMNQKSVESLEAKLQNTISLLVIITHVDECSRD